MLCSIMAKDEGQATAHIDVCIDTYCPDPTNIQVVNFEEV